MRLRHVLVVAVGLVGCTGSSSGESTDTTVPSSSATTDGVVVTDPPATTTTVPLCPVDLTVALPTWPFDPGDAFVTTAYDVDELIYDVVGITDDPEAVIVAALDDWFVDFDADEPTGGANDISLQFSSPRGTASVEMVTEDRDCWDVSVVAEFVERPTTVQPTPPPSAVTSTTDPDATVASSSPITSPSTGSDPTDPETTDPDAVGPATSETVDEPEPEPDTTTSTAPEDPLVELNAVGTGEIITARGAFALTVTECSTDPLLIRGVTDVGSLTITGDPGDAVLVTWQYDDGVTIVDQNAKSLALTELSGTLVADGENEDGPESLIIDFTCQ